MKYILANNARSVVAELLTAVGTSIVLDGMQMSAGMGQALSDVDANNCLFLTISDVGENYHEIVEVTSFDLVTYTATIVRAQSDTAAREWPIGSKVELRVHADLLENLNAGEPEDSVVIGAGGYIYPSAARTVAIGKDIQLGTSGTDGVAIGHSTYLASADCVVVGKGSQISGATEPRSIVIGYNGRSFAANAISIGDGTEVHGAGGIAIGKGSQAGGVKSVSIGDTSPVWSDGLVCIGHSYDGGGEDNAVIIGNEYTGGGCEEGVILGKGIDGGGGFRSIGIGSGVTVWYPYSAAIGAHAESKIQCAAHLALIPFQPKSTALPVTLHASDIETRHRTSPLITLASGIIDLTDIASTAQIEIPTGTNFFIDRIDAIITGVDTPGGTPAISVGTTAAGTDILGATVITKDAAQQRQKISPILDDGVTDIHISVTTAGTGTTYNCRVLVLGYMVENE